MTIAKYKAKDRNKKNAHKARRISADIRDLKAAHKARRDNDDYRFGLAEVGRA